MQPVLGCITLIAFVFAGTAEARSPDSCLPQEDGSNPCPVVLRKPESRPLSEMALIGKALFYDENLSGSGKLSCASCHDPKNHYAASGESSVFLGGHDLNLQGRRAVPTLTYLERRPNFSIGPDNPVSEDAPPIPANATGASHGSKNAANTAASAVNIVPQGGLFWDGRADTLQQQAAGPMYDPAEMASTPSKVLGRIDNAPYTASLKQLAGIEGEASPGFLLDEAMFALARYQIEDPAFHPYSSKFDSWLEGKEKLSSRERQGYLLFNDPGKGNCAACHLDTVQPGRLPPLFTDHQYEALGAPRNRELTQNRNPSYYDLGVCDRQPDGRKTLSSYCGMFATPTLRNTGSRHVFFHNGVFHSLKQVLDFYVLRELKPERFYAAKQNGHPLMYDDLPTKYKHNIDKTDAPFDRKPGDNPALSDQEIDDIIVFLKTLTDR
ncbi:cytochrome-c peroxidase [Acetobacter fallax]|nr:cytochrome c peroxidase [Acetobacter fallax]